MKEPQHNRSKARRPSTRRSVGSRSRVVTPVRLRPAEWVFPGHPDRLADAIADALVAEAASRHERALCGVEVALHRDVVFVDGRIACPDAEAIDVEGVVRTVYAAAGYGGAFAPEPAQLRVLTDLDLGPLWPGEDTLREISDDQAIVVGYWNSLPGCGGLPVEQVVVQEIGTELAALRLARPELLLGPDGKVLVVVAEHADGRVGWDELSASLQHAEGYDAVALERAVRDATVAVASRLASRIPGFAAEPPRSILVNGCGDFVCGGPHGDNGLSGKKLVVDGYGPRVPIGGGALHGKDTWKPDRHGPGGARDHARRICEREGVRECTVTMIVRPGDRELRVVGVEVGRGSFAQSETTRAAPYCTVELASGTACGTSGRE